MQTQGTPHRPRSSKRTASTKTSQISVRLERATDQWLERRAGGRQRKASFVRRLIEQEMEREREKALLGMFNAAAEEVTREDREERETVLGGLALDGEKE